MSSADFVLYEEEFKHLEEALRRLRQEANAKAVFLIDKNGQQIASAGEIEQFDTTSLASLTAGNVAATDGLAKLIGEREFSVLFHEGQQDHIHISIVAKRAILVVIFDDRSSLGLVRLRVKRASVDLERIFETMAAEERTRESDRRTRAPSPRSPTTTSTRSSASSRESPARQTPARRREPPAIGRRSEAQMTFINYASKEINCKIVYYGPGLCGKTTNLQYIYNKTAPESKGKMISLATEADRTLFFDFLPLDLGSIRGFTTRFHLYTVPGQVFYDASRKLILKGVDGVVFVADSQEERMEANIESIRNLEAEPEGARLRPRDDPLRPAVQQARPAQRGAGRRDVPHPQLQAGAHLRGGRHHRRRGLRHPEVGGQADPDRAQEALRRDDACAESDGARQRRRLRCLDDRSHQGPRSPARAGAGPRPRRALRGASSQESDVPELRERAPASTWPACRQQWSRRRKADAAGRGRRPLPAGRLREEPRATTPPPWRSARKEDGDQKDERFAYLAASIHAAEGRTDEAAKALSRAIELNPKNRVHAFHDPDFAELRGTRDHRQLFGLS